jgi:class 3 adenylate cyclase
MPTTETANVKYVFVDVVGFTKDRSVEAQSDVVRLLNDVIRQALKSCKLEDEKLILIPTGDGVAIAIIDSKDWDVDLRLGVAILDQVETANQKAADNMRKFAVRVGVNENVDNLVNDINGRNNVAGSGISQAQRMMDKADANQILVGRTVFERLSPREKYMSKFQGYVAQGKHGTTLPVYQYVDKTVAALNTDAPAAFQKRKLVKPKFTKFAAYYLAHAIKNRETLLSISGPGREATGTVLLYFLALDSVTESERPAHEEKYLRTWGAEKSSFTEQYEYYAHIDYKVILDFAGLICRVYFGEYSDYFESHPLGLLFVTPAGRRKLSFEWPEIADELDVADDAPAEPPTA